MLDQPGTLWRLDTRDLHMVVGSDFPTLIIESTDMIHDFDLSEYSGLAVLAVSDRMHHDLGWGIGLCVHHWQFVLVTESVDSS